MTANFFQSLSQHGVEYLLISGQASLSIEPDDFDSVPFNQKGGLGKAHQLFGEHLGNLLEELNQQLVA